MTIKPTLTVFTKKILLITLFPGFLSGFAQNTDVEFRVNMKFFIEEGRFFPQDETVDIAGTFNGWGAELTPMNDENNDSIYTAILYLPVGTNVEFKCRINGEWNGREEFAGGGPNRSYTVEENGVVEFWYNDETPDDFLIPAFYTPAVVAETGEPVQFFDASSGEPVAWEWEFPGGTPFSSEEQNPVVVYNEPGSYDIRLLITGTGGQQAWQTFQNAIRIDPMDTPWWNDRVFYEIFVRSFKDSNGDGIGDFQGMIDQLDYLNDGDPSTSTDLGIGGIWLMPVAQSPSYHGYDATDYRTIEQDYGTNEGFIQFMEEAHARDVKVIVDLVMNHNSSEHPWFIASQDTEDPKRDWYVWSDTNPGFNGPWGQQVWHYHNGDYYYGLFWSGMPDLNYENPEVKEEMFDVARYWLEDMNADGFRLDAVKYIFEDGIHMQDIPPTIQFWKDFRAFYKEVNPDAFAVGEAWTSTNLVSLYVEDGALDYCFEFDLAYTIMNTVRNGYAPLLQDAIRNAMTAFPFLQFGTFLTNHDMDRVMSVLEEDEQLARLAAAILLTLPGVPYIYYGEEIGMTGAGPHPDIRTPMQWNSSNNAGFTSGTPWKSVNNDFGHRNVEEMQNDPNSLWHHYRKFIQLRNREPALTQGNYRPVYTNNEQVLAFLRQKDEDHLLVLANMGWEPLDNLTVSVDYGALPQGNHLFLDLFDQDEQMGISVDGNGGFQNMTVNQISAKQLKVFKLNNTVSAPTTIEKKYDINILPNPAREETTALISQPGPSDFQLTISDLSGRVLMVKTIRHIHAGQKHSIKTGSLNKGTYIIEISDNKNRHVEKMVIE